MRVAGARVLVTGASSGIGAATARLMARAGATVGIVGRRSSLLEAVLEDCRESSPASSMWVADLGDSGVAERLVEEAWDAFGGLDILVNNAAIPKRRAVTALTPGEVDHTMQVNFFAPVRMTLHLLPRMLQGAGGVIVNVSSMGGRLGIPHEAAYCASKFALCGWSEAMAIDLAGTNVSVRLIEPGPIDTDIWDRPGEDDALFDVPKVPPEVVAEGIVAAVEGEGFEHYLPDLKAVVTGKDADIDAYITGIAAAIPAERRTGRPTVAPAGTEGA
ncbi:MAG TPA: SDR family oxidoreductase [Acidimicrobiales bacterium]|nr:SDR family oxidoreductase [Acidimicrobiales bacterium]